MVLRDISSPFFVTVYKSGRSRISLPRVRSVFHKLTFQLSLNLVNISQLLFASANIRYEIDQCQFYQNGIYQELKTYVRSTTRHSTPGVSATTFAVRRSSLEERSSRKALCVVKTTYRYSLKGIIYNTAYEIIPDD